MLEERYLMLDDSLHDLVQCFRALGLELELTFFIWALALFGHNLIEKLKNWFGGVHSHFCRIDCQAGVKGSLWL